MKKRCTNSLCRKMFTAGPVCPHCGKKYPRLDNINKSRSVYRVFLDDYNSEKIRVIKAVRTARPGLNLRAAKELVESCPCKVYEGRSGKDANCLYLELINLGVNARIKHLKR